MNFKWQFDYLSKLEIFSECMECAGNIPIWHYDKNLHLQEVSDRSLIFFDHLLQLSGNREILLSYCWDSRLPGLFSDSLGLLYLALPLYHEEALTRIILFGPVFVSAMSENTLKSSVSSMHLSRQVAENALETLAQIPICPHNMFMQYGIMLHRLLTGQVLSTSDIVIVSGKSSVSNTLPLDWNDTSAPDWYMKEQQLFTSVTDGNTHYIPTEKDFLKNPDQNYRFVPLRQIKNDMIAHITLISRAAIRGGFSSASAFTLADHFLQMLEACQTVSDALSCCVMAHKDFTARVALEKRKQGYSKEILDCIDYVQLHLTDRFSLETLAEELGYNKSYLSTKFKRETGRSLWDYINYTKIDISKRWLIDTNMRIQDISQQLHFCSSSYYCKLFKNITAMSPKEFRDRRGVYTEEIMARGKNTEQN